MCLNLFNLTFLSIRINILTPGEFSMYLKFESPICLRTFVKFAKVYGHDFEEYTSTNSSLIGAGFRLSIKDIHLLSTQPDLLSDNTWLLDGRIAMDHVCSPTDNYIYVVYADNTYNLY